MAAAGNPEMVSMVSTPPKPAAVSTVGEDVTPAASQPARPINRMLGWLQGAAHPVTCVFHAAFKVAVLLVYFNGRYISGGYVCTFILSTVFAALDFWTVKNVTGRVLVGLRWWNHVREDGSQEWVFESNPKEDSLNATDRNVFW